MPNFDPAQALSNTPRLKSLHLLLAKVELEHPEVILVADSPFFIYQDGTPHYGPLVNARFIPVRSFKKGSALKSELEVLAHGFSAGVYPEILKEQFELWALDRLRDLRTAARRTDREKVLYLKARGLLN